jgi:hypothetical protein
MSTSLPRCPDLDQLRRQAKELREAAGSAAVAAVGLMLELGFSPDAPRGFGERPLHCAAYAGNAGMGRLLIDAGADVDSRDARFDSTPLAFATVGSGERAGQSGNWVEVVRSLVEAGASREGVWISVKPPSEEVLDWHRSLRTDGICATVESVEVDRDAVVLGLSVARRAAGAGPTPTELLYQVFTVEHEQIIDIHAYLDRASALRAFDLTRSLS